MKGRELDRFVELSAAACDGCQKAYVRIGWSHTDLNRAARNASRNPSPRNLAALATAQAKLREARDQALEHIETHEESEAS